MRIRSSAGRDRLAFEPDTDTQSFADAGDNRIGSVLAREGYIDNHDIELILREQAVSGQLFGETAIAMGKITPEILDYALAKQADSRTLAPGDGRVDPMLVAAFDLNHAYVNNIRTLRSKILQQQPVRSDSGIRACALVGLDCDEEISVLAANLAIVMVRMGTPTLLIDAGLHNPRQHSLFHVPNRLGFINLRDNISSPDLGAQPTAIDRLWVIPTGPKQPDASHALERQSILSKIEQWSVPSTQLLVSLPLSGRGNMHTVADTVAGFDSAVLVVRKDKSRISDMRVLIDGLDEKKVPIAGFVIV